MLSYGKLLIKNNPEYINYFIAGERIEYKKDSSVWNSKKRIKLSNINGSCSVWLTKKYKFYADNNKDCYRIYAWIWYPSISIQGDSTFVVIKERTENLRIGSNMKVIGYVEKGVTGKIMHVNPEKSWAFVEIPVHANIKVITSSKPSNSFETYDCKSDGLLPDEPRKMELKALRRYSYHVLKKEHKRKK